MRIVDEAGFQFSKSRVGILGFQTDILRLKVYPSQLKHVRLESTFVNSLTSNYLDS